MNKIKFLDDNLSFISDNAVQVGGIVAVGVLGFFLLNQFTPLVLVKKVPFISKFLPPIIAGQKEFIINNNDSPWIVKLLIKNKDIHTSYSELLQYVEYLQNLTQSMEGGHNIIQSIL